VGRLLRVERCERLQLVAAATRICIATCHDCVFYVGVNRPPLLIGDNRFLQARTPLPARRPAADAPAPALAPACLHAPSVCTCMLRACAPACSERVHLHAPSVCTCMLRACAPACSERVHLHAPARSGARRRAHGGSAGPGSSCSSRGSPSWR